MGEESLSSSESGSSSPEKVVKPKKKNLFDSESESESENSEKRELFGEKSELEEDAKDQKRFENAVYDDLEKGRIVFELQKSYNGDSRFKLNPR